MTQQQPRPEPDPQGSAGPRLVLNQRVHVLNRSDGSIQFGWDPEHALMLRPPPGVDSAALADRLQLMQSEHGATLLASSVAELGLSRSQTTAIIAELDAAGLLDRPDRALRHRSVRVHGRGPLADAMWSGLRRLGLSTNGSRSQRSGLNVAGWRNDVVILADDLVPDPQLVDQLLDTGLAHLQVRIRDGRGIVGPMVIAGHTSCLRCADLTRRDHDAEWPFLAAQLLGRIGHARPAAVAATAAMALDQLDAFCSVAQRRRPAVFDATLELDLESHRIARRQWPRHHACGCHRNPKEDRSGWFIAG